MKELINYLFSRMGYNISKQTNVILGFPTEATVWEVGLMSELLGIDHKGFIRNEKRLTMLFDTPFVGCHISYKVCD